MIYSKTALKPLLETGALLIVRTSEPSDAIRIARAAVQGGIRALEIPYAVPDTLELVRELVNMFSDDGVAVGVGTVLDEISAYRAIEAGASILVSPTLNRKMIEVANRYQVTSISGAMTPSEIMDTATAGADIVKLFPAEFLGPNYLKSISTPLGQVPISPTGGIDDTTAAKWIDAGACCLGVSSFICKAPTDEEITSRATDLLNAISNARAE